MLYFSKMLCYGAIIWFFFFCPPRMPDCAKFSQQTPTEVVITNSQTSAICCIISALQEQCQESAVPTIRSGLWEIGKVEHIHAQVGRQDGHISGLQLQTAVLCCSFTTVWKAWRNYWLWEGRSQLQKWCLSRWSQLCKSFTGAIWKYKYCTHLSLGGAVAVIGILQLQDLCSHETFPTESKVTAKYDVEALN